MVKTKREYIFAACFLSGAAAILSFVSLGTDEWVSSPVTFTDNGSNADSSSSVQFGLFGGTFNQKFGVWAKYQLSTVCAYDLNICALLCGDDMTDYLRKMHDGEDIKEGLDSCPIYDLPKAFRSSSLRASDNSEMVFINAGMWMCTIIFLILSAVMGLFCAGLSVWNIASNPYQALFSIFGLYIYNAIAFFLLLLAMILWGAVFAQTFTENIPTYKTYKSGFTTDAKLGYSYWLLLPALLFYLLSICLFYVRQYLISKEPKVNVQLEDNADPVILLY